MTDDRARELWARLLAGEALPPAEEQDLLASLGGDERLRREFLDDAEIHGALRARGWSQRHEASILRSLSMGAEAASRDAGFIRKLERRIRKEGRWKRFVLPAAAAAGVLLALSAALLLLSPRPAPRDLSVQPPPGPGGVKPKKEEPVRKEALPPRAPEPPPRREEVPERKVEKKEEPPPEPPLTETVPPEPPMREEPEPPPVPETPAPPRPATIPVVARLLGTSGQVFVVADSVRREVRKAQVLLAGQGVETAGPLSWAFVVYGDDTRFELLGDTAVREIHDQEAARGKRLQVEQGTCLARVARQAPGSPMVFLTPHGEARVLGTSLRIVVETGEKGFTRLEIEEGRVQLRRLRDGKSVEVTGGNFAVAAAGVELQVRPLPQEGKGHPGVDLKKTDAAVEKGVQWLVKQTLEGAFRGYRKDELVLYTLLHARVSPQQPMFRSLLKNVTETELLERTYCVSLQAMFLSEFDPVRYQLRIAQCGQFLVDNQAANGQWDYGEPTTYSKDVATVAAPKDGAAKRRPPRAIVVRRRRDGPEKGDNSNSQYAALGLRACLEANVLPPRETLERARAWWERNQLDDGGWDYSAPRSSTGSMTAGGLGGLIICKHYLRESWAADHRVVKGVEWMARNFSASENPRGHGWPLYYLYALERAGILSARPAFGPHDWYRAGANHLLAAQKADGSWDGGGGEGRESAEPLVDTCFAILFLRKATMPLADVPSVDRFHDRQGGEK